MEEERSRAEALKRREMYKSHLEASGKLTPFVSKQMDMTRGRVEFRKSGFQR